MKKPNRFDKLSDTRCVDCGRQIKQNLVGRKRDGTPLLCFKCWTILQYHRGHIMCEKVLLKAGIKHVYDVGRVRD